MDKSATVEKSLRLKTMASATVMKMTAEFRRPVFAKAPVNASRRNSLVSMNLARVEFHNLQHGLCMRKSNKYDLLPACAVASEDASASSSPFEDFSVTNATNINENRELKIRVEVSGTKTRAIFNNVFDEMVAEAQPIPGFRRVKGGKTPNIPRDVLLEILGPSKVYKQVVKKVINSTVAAYVEKEALKVGKDLRIEQSYEDLEDQFEPDEKFFFDAIIQLKETN